MSQQLSPWLEGAYGWNFGESGWNSGMDQNLLKFSFMFDGNVDSIVASLPSVSNGAAHFLSTDNRVYFGVGNTWYSSPIPKHFIFKIKSTGAFYQFNGSSAVLIDNPTQLDSRLDGVELTISSLGTAAFQDVGFFATQGNLDVVEAGAAGYTDTLRSDVGNVSDSLKGAALIGYRNRNARSKFDESISVKDFGAVGNGIANDRSAINAAFSSGFKSIYFPSGTYYIGSLGSGEVAFNLSAMGNGVSIHTDSSVEIVANTTAGISVVFLLTNNNNFSCGHIRFRDTGYDPLVTWKGTTAFYLENDGISDWSGVNIASISAKNVVSPITIAGASAKRIRGINIGTIISDDCYYGFNAQNQGDVVTVGILYTYMNYRPYFAYGCTSHNVNIFNNNARAGSGALNISRSVGGFDTSGLNLTYTSRANTVDITHVLINHIDLLGGTIKDIKVHLDIESSSLYYPVRFVNYTGAGGSETSAASANNVYDIHLSGTCDSAAREITAPASYASKARLLLQTGQNFVPDSTIPNKFRMSGASLLNYSTVWTAASVNPSIGNGTLVGKFSLHEGLCFYTIELTIGSTTTTGTGDWAFSAPIASQYASVGTARVLDSGSSWYVGASSIEAAGSSIQVNFNNLNLMSATNPFTFAVGDKAIITICYPI